VACWSTKAAISLKHVKIEEKLLWRAYRNPPTLVRTVPSPAPYGLLLPKIGGSQPHPKLQSLLSRARVKLYGLQIWPIHSQGPSEQKPIKKFGEKAVWAYQGLPKFFGYPLLSLERVKLRTSNFVRTFIGCIGTKARYKSWVK